MEEIDEFQRKITDSLINDRNVLIFDVFLDFLKVFLYNHPY